VLFLAHVFFERPLGANAFGDSVSKDGTRILRASERMEVKASASELCRKECGIGLGDVADGTEANAMEARFGFGSDAPQAGSGKRSKAPFCFFRRDDGQAVRLFPTTPHPGHAFGSP